MFDIDNGMPCQYSFVDMIYDKIVYGNLFICDTGTAVGYHGITYGMYVDALVRKTDPQHRNMSQFFQEEIANVLGMLVLFFLLTSCH